MFLKASTYLYLVALLSLVFSIYFFENKVDGLRAEINEKKNTIEKYKQEITMLEAEWSYQNNPERLAEIMFRLNWGEEPLQTPTAAQFTEIHNLPDNSTYFSKLTAPLPVSLR